MFTMKYSEASEMLGVSLGTVYQLVSHSKLHSQAVEGIHDKMLDPIEVIRYKYRKQPSKADEVIRAMSVTGQAPAQGQSEQEAHEQLSMFAKELGAGAGAPGQSRLQFVSVVCEIFTSKARYEEEANVKMSQAIQAARISRDTELRTILQPIAEKVASSPADTTQLMLLAAQKMVENDPDMSKGAITEETLQRLTQAIPLRDDYRERLQSILRTEAKRDNLYTIDTRQAIPA